MNEHLRDRILRKLETLSDERGYQVLDYVEFLESRYGEKEAPGANAFTKFTEAIEDKLRAGKVSASAIAETVGFMNRAASVLNSSVSSGPNVWRNRICGLCAASGRHAAMTTRARQIARRDTPALYLRIGVIYRPCAA